MGSSENEPRYSEYDGREEPQHEVCIDYTFAVGQCTVTFAEWDAAQAAGAKLEKPDDRGWGRERRPVINVSWDDAQAYLEWLNDELDLSNRMDAYRLPSEAEWEYACRAGTATRYSFGETLTTAQANFYMDTPGQSENRRRSKKTLPVGSFPANEFGLYDMHGNVWEWCEDPWSSNFEGAPNDGSVWNKKIAGSARVVRGGAWYNAAEFLRSACRGSYLRTNRSYCWGFRLARTISDTP
jgi:formylglycine-generating enzyme required for sulfatase activity